LRCFVAVRARPVERLLAVAFWKLVPETGGSLTAEFQWSALPALGNEFPAFLEALVAHVAEQEPDATALAMAEWLPSSHPSDAMLRALGFAVVGTRRYLQADAAAWCLALGAEPPPAGDALPAPPHPDHFDGLRALLCGASLRPSELAHGFHTAWSESPSLFDPRCSGVILESGKMVAACLANASHGHLTLAALAGPDEPYARLLHHCLQGRDRLAEPATLGFHLDDRDPPAALAALMEHLPHHAAGQFVRYARPLAAAAGHGGEQQAPAGVTATAAPAAPPPFRNPHAADSGSKKQEQTRQEQPPYEKETNKRR
jgi:hypothetical protein